MLVPSPAHATSLAGCTRPIDRCNALVDVRDDGEVEFCDAVCTVVRFHLCQKHAKAPTLLLERAAVSSGCQVNAQLMRWCNKCRVPVPLGHFSGLAPVCDLHSEDPRVGEGRRPVVDEGGAAGAVAVGAEVPQLGSISVADAALADALKLSTCDVTTCTKDAMCAGLCAQHKLVCHSLPFDDLRVATDFFVLKALA